MKNLSNKKQSMYYGFSERVNALLEEKWKGSNSSFFHRYNIAKTTFYDVTKYKRDVYTEYVIELFARAFGVSVDYLKYGGGERGYYKPKLLRYQVLKEDDIPYVYEDKHRKKKNTIMVAEADIEIRRNTEEGVIEFVAKFKEGEFLS